MSWSERQALAKKKTEEEEAQSKAAMASAPAVGSTPKWKAPVAAGLGFTAGATTAAFKRRDEEEPQQEEEDWDAV